MGSVQSSSSTSSIHNDKTQSKNEKSFQVSKFENRYNELKTKREEIITYGEEVCNMFVSQMKMELNKIITENMIKRKVVGKFCKFVNIVFHIDNCITDNSTKTIKEKDNTCTIYVPLTFGAFIPENIVIVLDRMHSRICDDFFKGFKITYNRNQKIGYYGKATFIFEIEVDTNTYECPLKNKETEKLKNQPQVVAVTKAKPYSGYDSDSDDETVVSKADVIVKDEKDKDEFYELYNKFAEQLNEANMKIYNDDKFDSFAFQVQHDLLNTFAYQVSYL
jgi:hypothetical protein